MRYLLRAVLLLIVTWVMCVLALVFFETHIVFPAYLRGSPEVPVLAAETQVLKRNISDGSVEAWFLPSRPDFPAKGTVVLFHGNAELIDDYLPRARWWVLQGFHVLIPEYRGYGRSSGVPTVDSIVEDAAWFLQELAEAGQINLQELVFEGRSIGTGLAFGLAKDYPPQFMVLVSPLTSLEALAWKFGVPPVFVSQKMENLEIQKQLKLPLFIAHGIFDRTVPFTHGAQLAAASPHMRFLPYNADHNDLYLDELFFSELLSFIEFLETSF